MTRTDDDRFAVAYIRSWHLALPMSSILPGIMLAGAIMGGTVAKLKKYAPIFPLTSSQTTNPTLTSSHPTPARASNSSLTEAPSPKKSSPPSGPPKHSGRRNGSRQFTPSP